MMRSDEMRHGWDRKGREYQNADRKVQQRTGRSKQICLQTIPPGISISDPWYSTARLILMLLNMMGERPFLTWPRRDCTAGSIATKMTCRGR